MLIKNGRVTSDPFTAVAEGDPVPDGPVIVPLKRFLAERDALLARVAPLGVRLDPAESPEALGEDVHRLALVLLMVPYFRDGRAFSWARLLRTRLGFTGEIRVGGHVLRDQFAFFARVGVDSFDVTQNLSPDDIARAFSEITNAYQPSVRGRATMGILKKR